MDEAAPRRRVRPAPLDAPVAAARGNEEELAREWLLALIADRPLGDAPALPTAEVAEHGPDVCRALLTALASDSALEDLRHEHESLRSLARLAGREGAPGVVRAVEALRAVLWRELAPEAGESSSAVADRLSHVCAVAAEEAVGLLEPAADRPAPDQPSRAEIPEEDPSAPGDELGRVRALRGSDAPLWREALERRLEQARAASQRLALVLLEFDGADRLRGADAAGAATAFERAGRAVRAVVRRADVLAHEDEGRIWIVAEDAGRAGASALAERLGARVETAATAGGAPLTASVGIAVYPEDGRDAEALTGHAEEGVWAARAEGRTVGNGVEPGLPPDGDFSPGPVPS